MNDMEKQEKAKMVQEVADNKIAEGKDTKKEKKDEVSMLTELLEERPNLWDVFNKDYSKRDLKNTAYKEIADVFGCNITSIKGNQWIRAQYGRELAKVNKSKSGQSIDEFYVSNWTHYQSLTFLEPVIKSSSSKAL